MIAPLSASTNKTNASDVCCDGNKRVHVRVVVTLVVLSTIGVIVVAAAALRSGWFTVLRSNRAALKITS